MGPRPSRPRGHPRARCHVGRDFHAHPEASSDLARRSPDRRASASPPDRGPSVVFVLVATGFLLGARLSGRGRALLRSVDDRRHRVPALFSPRSGIAADGPPLTVSSRSSLRRSCLDSVEPGTLLAMPAGHVLPRRHSSSPGIAACGPLGFAYAAVFCGVILATGGRPWTRSTVDLGDECASSACSSAGSAGELLERMRERTLQQEIELVAQSALQIRATTDALTGLANRRQLDADLDVEHVSPRRRRVMRVHHARSRSLQALNDELGTRQAMPPCGGCPPSSRGHPWRDSATVRSARNPGDHARRLPRACAAARSGSARRSPTWRSVPVRGLAAGT